MEAPATPTVETPATPTGRNAPLRLADIWPKLCTRIQKGIESDGPLKQNDRNQLIRDIVDALDEQNGHVSRAQMRAIASELVAKAPSTFAAQFGDAVKTLVLTLENRRDNFNKRHKRKRDVDSPTVDKRSKKAKLDSYGCVSWAPDLPEGETSDSQEELRLNLTKAFETGLGVDEVAAMMETTYASQRALINGKIMTPEMVINQWPYLQMEDHLMNHYNKLTGKDIGQFKEEIKTFGHQVYSFTLMGMKHTKEQSAILEIIDGAPNPDEAKWLSLPMLVATHMREDYTQLIRTVPVSFSSYSIIPLPS